ncbi:MAG: Uncharacterised protein [SAR116 cluster bacterium]|nr:MAG: Uncharacterised protein [SAR116 cluster bacterium]
MACNRSAANRAPVASPWTALQITLALCQNGSSVWPAKYITVRQASSSRISDNCVVTCHFFHSSHSGSFGSPDTSLPISCERPAAPSQASRAMTKAVSRPSISEGGSARSAITSPASAARACDPPPTEFASARSISAAAVVPRHMTRVRLPSAAGSAPTSATPV